MKTQSSLFIIGALAASLSALPSCSSTGDEPPIDTSTGNAIRFAPNIEYSRAGDITTNTLTTFNVYAYTGSGTSPVTFMDNVVVTKTASNTWTYSPVEYWPAKKTVDFYAFAPASWLDGKTPLSGIPYESYPGTEDIIYAVNTDMSGSAGSANAQVVFNFRHALSKLTVKMSSTNQTLAVRVTNVALANIMTKGNFHFPSASTSDEPGIHTVGTWTDQNTPQTYILHMSQTPSDIITLTTTATDMGTTTVPGSRYLIPQALTWLNNGSDSDTYIVVMCSVYDAASGTKLWPNDKTPSENVVEGSTFGDGLLKFPLSTSAFKEWKPGCHYVYNLIINSNEDMGAIEFGAPSVEGFINVENTYQ